MSTPISTPRRPFTWQEAQALGFKRREIDDMLSARQLVRVLRGVYQPADLVNSPHTRVQAAALVVRPFEVICDRLAAWVHGVDTFSITEIVTWPPIETCVPPNRTRLRRSGCSGVRRDLEPGDVEWIDGVQVTTALRTALDLGCNLRGGVALATLDQFLRIDGVTLDAMTYELERFRGRRGVVQLRRLLPLADPRSESPGESFTRMVMIEEGLPLPDLQLWVTQGGKRVFRLDLAYEWLRIAVEYDGMELHTTPEQRAHDLARRQWLAERGWTVIVVRKGDLSKAGRTEWIGQLRSALRLAA